MNINLLFESLHLIEFAVLYLLFVGALLVNKKFTKATNYVAATVAVVYGFVDEVHQLYVVGRSFTVIDLVKNCVGVTLAFLIVHVNSFGGILRKFK